MRDPLLLIGWLGLLSSAALAAEPDWTLPVGERPRATLATGAGVVVVALGDALLGVDPATGTELWRRARPEGNARDLLHPVPGTGLFVASGYAPALGPPVFEVVSATTGETLWADTDGLWQLGLFGGPDGGVLEVVSADASLQTVAVFRVDPETATMAWPAAGAIDGAPVLSSVHPTERCDAWTVRGSPGPLFVGDAVLTRWSPVDGLVLRDWATGTLRWRLKPPTLDKVLPVLGAPDLVTRDGVLYALLGDRELTAVRLEDGAVQWRPRRFKKPIRAVAPASEQVVVAAGRDVEGRSVASGARLWRVRSDGAEIRDVQIGGGLAFALDDGGVVRALDLGDGSVHWERAVGDGDLEPVERLVLRGDAVVAVLPAGAVGLDPATGEVRWDVAGAPVGDLSNRRFQGTGTVRGGAPYDSRALYREPAADPSGGRYHVWQAQERVGRATHLVVHRTDLDSGTDHSVVLPSDVLEWTLDGAREVVVAVAYGGELQGWRLRSPEPSQTP